jgi:hypothetical protein
MSKELTKASSHNNATKNIIKLSSDLNGGYWGNIQYQRRKTSSLLNQDEFEFDDNNIDTNDNPTKTSPSFMSPVVTPGNIITDTTQSLLNFTISFYR